MSRLFILLIICISFHGWSYAQTGKQSAVIFEDFDYRSIAYPARGEKSNSIFGKNPWLTKQGYRPLLAWVRYNGDFHEFGPHSFLDIIPEGIRLRMEPGKLKNEIQPLIASTFNLRHGTYAARVRFGRLDPDDKITDAYWLVSPVVLNFNKDGKNIQYREEMDFEWNNWWFGKSKTNMSVGVNNHNYLKPISHNLEYILDKNGDKSGYKSDDKLANELLIGGQWAVCLFVVDTAKKTVAISLRVDSLNSIYSKVWGGDSRDEDSWGKGFEIKNYVPSYDMAVIFSIGAHADEVSHETSMDVDWFLYLPGTNTGYDEIDKLVDGYKSSHIARINTFGAEFNENFSPDIKNDLYFDGPEVIYSCPEKPGQTAPRWMIKSHKNLAVDNEVSFAYRYFSDGKWGSWDNVYSNELSVEPGKGRDSLELYMTVKDKWKDNRDTVRQVVRIIDNCK